MNGFLKNMIRTLAKENQALMVSKSLQNYIIPGITSIILHSSPYLTYRLYISKEGESRLDKSLDKNDETLMIHNHGFHFESKTLVGSMLNILFDTKPLSKYSRDWGRFYQYDYISSFISGQPQHNFKLKQEVNLWETAYYECHARTISNNHYEMNTEQYHRIEIPKNILTAILFVEHKRVLNTTTLFSRNPYLHVDGVNTIELYKKMALKQINEDIELVLDNMES